MRHYLPRCAALVAILGLAGSASAVPLGGFAVVLDADANNGDSSKTAVVYDIDDMSTPLFAMYVGWKKATLSTVLSTTTISGTHRSPDAVTVDPNTGDIYILARDSDSPSGVTTPTPALAPAYAAANIPDSTEGDYDILKMDFQSTYNQWEANQASFQATFGSTYVTFVNDPITPGVVTDTSITFQRNADGDGNSPGNKNEVLFQGFMTKIGEVANPLIDKTDTEPHLEFVDQNTLLLVDVFTADLDNTRGIDGTFGPNDIPANDREVRALRRVSTSPNLATEPTGPSISEGGWNRGTTESWESTVLGRVNMDGAVGDPTGTTSEVVSTTFYKDPATGVMGLWIAESDIGGDQVGFFEIADLNGDDTGAGSTNLNGFRDFNVAGGTPFFILDNDPTVDPLTNDGNADGIHVNPNTGDIFMIESGNFDTIDDGIDQDGDGNTANEEFGHAAFGAHEPSIILREVTSYDNGSGQIDFGAWKTVKLDFSGPDGIAGNADDIVDDDGLVTDGRRTVYDYVTNTMYFYDFDSPGTTVHGAFNGGAPNVFEFDWYGVDLTSGAVTAGFLDSDESTRGFGTEDRYEFFCLGASCSTFVDPFPAALLAGDFNADGFVGIDDLNILLANWNTTVTAGDLTVGDADGSGFIGVDDLNVLLANWNAGTPPPPGLIIPEPASLALFTMAGLSVLARRRSRAG